MLIQYLVMLYSHNIWLRNECVAVYFGGLVILFKLKHKISAEFIPVNQAIRCNIDLQSTSGVSNKINTNQYKALISQREANV